MGTAPLAAWIKYICLHTMGDGHPWMTHILLVISLMTMMTMVDLSPLTPISDTNPKSLANHVSSNNPSSYILQIPPTPQLAKILMSSSSHNNDDLYERYLQSLSRIDNRDTEDIFSRKRRNGKCLFNSLAYNCDFQDAIGAANEASYWGSSSPGKRKRFGGRPDERIGQNHF